MYMSNTYLAFDQILGIQLNALEQWEGPCFYGRINKFFLLCLNARPIYSISIESQICNARVQARG
jgi:hypothetical protein